MLWHHTNDTFTCNLLAKPITQPDTITVSVTGTRHQQKKMQKLTRKKKCLKPKIKHRNRLSGHSETHIQQKKTFLASVLPPTSSSVATVVATTTTSVTYELQTKRTRIFFKFCVKMVQPRALLILV